MKFRILFGAVALCAMASVVAAQTSDVDCEDAANAEDEACLALLPPGGAAVTNFAPLVGPLAAAGLFGVAAAGAGGTTSTTSTTSTTASGGLPSR